MRSVHRDTASAGAAGPSVTPSPTRDPAVDPVGVTAEDFRDAMARLAAGVAVVTTRDVVGRDLGITVTSFTPVSLDPPLVLVCVRRDGFVADALAVSDGWAVSMLSEDQVDLARYAARHRHPGSRDDLSPWPHRRGVGGAPVLTGGVSLVECLPYAEHEAGDHLVVIGRVVAVEVRPDRRPLLYVDRRYRAEGDDRGRGGRDEEAPGGPPPGEPAGS